MGLTRAYLLSFIYTVRALLSVRDFVEIIKKSHSVIMIKQALFHGVSSVINVPKITRFSILITNPRLWV